MSWFARVETKRRLLAAGAAVLHVLVLHALRTRIHLAMEGGGGCIHSFRLHESAWSMVLILTAFWLLAVYIHFTEEAGFYAVCKFVGQGLLGLALGVPRDISSLKETEWTLSYPYEIYEEFLVAEKLLEAVGVVLALFLLLLPEVRRRVKLGRETWTVLYMIAAFQGVFLLVFLTVPYNAWYLVLVICGSAFAVGLLAMKEDVYGKR